MDIFNGIIMGFKTTLISLSLYYLCLLHKNTIKLIIRGWVKRKIVDVEYVLECNGMISENKYKIKWLDKRAYLYFFVSLMFSSTMIILAASALGIKDGFHILIVLHVFILSCLLMKRYIKQTKLNKVYRKKEAYNGMSIY